MWINQQILEQNESRKRAAVIKYFIAVAEVSTKGIFFQ